jgi:hypothetical protein
MAVEPSGDRLRPLWDFTDLVASEARLRRPSHCSKRHSKRHAPRDRTSSPASGAEGGDGRRHDRLDRARSRACAAVPGGRVLNRLPPEQPRLVACPTRRALRVARGLPGARSHVLARQSREFKSERILLTGVCRCLLRRDRDPLLERGGLRVDAVGRRAPQAVASAATGTGREAKPVA